MKISPVIIAKDASKTIGQTIESLKSFDEVIVYDTGSEDETIEIASKFKNVKICKGPFTGFGESKNKAALFAKYDWILSIDADEVVGPKLLDSIQNLQMDEFAVYRFKRFNYYRNRRIRYSGWGREYVTRIYNKTKMGFNDKLVHENIESGDAKIITIDGELRHFSYHSISDFIRKRDLYAELFAMENAGKKKSSPFMAFIKGTFNFLNTFLIKSAFLDGYRGLLISVSNANVSFYKYLKLYEANIHDNKKISLIITTYNWKEALYLTLTSVLNQTIPPNEIIVADDGSRDDTREMIEEFAKKCFIPIIHSWQEDNGFRLARSRNLAIAKSNYNYIVIIDGDLILHKNFISDHLKNAEKGFFLQGSRALLSEKLTKKILVTKKIILPPFYSVDLGNRFNSMNIPFFSWLYSLKKSRSHNSIRGCNISFFKEDLYKVNGFNEDFVGWGREDSELVERLYNYGLYRKYLKFAGILYHFYHHISKTSSTNDEILNRAIAEDLKWCENGLDKYFMDKI